MLRLVNVKSEAPAEKAEQSEEEIVAEGVVALRRMATCHRVLPYHARRAVEATERALSRYAPRRVDGKGGR